MLDNASEYYVIKKALVEDFEKCKELEDKNFCAVSSINDLQNLSSYRGELYLSFEKAEFNIVAKLDLL